MAVGNSINFLLKIWNDFERLRFALYIFTYLYTIYYVIEARNAIKLLEHEIGTAEWRLYCRQPSHVWQCSLNDKNFNNCIFQVIKIWSEINPKASLAWFLLMMSIFMGLWLLYSPSWYAVMLIKSVLQRVMMPWWTYLCFQVIVIN